MAVVPATSAAIAAASSPYAYPMCTRVRIVAYGCTYHRPTSGALRCPDRRNGTARHPARADEITGRRSGAGRRVGRWPAGGRAPRWGTLPRGCAGTG
ncbi:hypothetical protein DDE05_24910, partial [Streptomyces cavourensis]